MLFIACMLVSFLLISANDNNNKKKDNNDNDNDNNNRQLINYVPLNEDREDMVGIKKFKQLGCHFGGKLYELEEEWHPNLGPPFGVMTCIKCKCLVIQKKRRVVGRVACKNFVDQCPVPACSNPVMLPNRCCKTCPGSNDIELNVFGSSDYGNDNSRDHGYQEYMAVLTGRFRQPTVATEGVGRVYVTLSRRDLHFSVYFEKLEELPVSIQIIDKLNSIVYEKPLDKFELSDKKVCGVWTDVPLLYLKSLKKDELLIVVTTAKQSDGALGGRIFRPKIITREVFGALLFPSTMRSIKNLGYGGVAIVDVEAGGEALNLAVWFDAAVNLSSGYSRSVFISLEKDDGRRRPSQSTRAELIFKNGYYVAEKIIQIGAYEQRWLNAGKLLVVVHAEFMVPSELVGLLLPKQSCDVYQAILTEETYSNFQQPSEIVVSALLHITNNSTLEYTITASGLNLNSVTGFTLDKENRRHKRRTVLSNDGPLGLDVVNNKIRGRSTNAVNLRDLESFYKEKLFFGLTVNNTNLILRGAIRRLLTSESVSGRGKPYLLSGKSRSVGSLWLSDPINDSSNRNRCSGLKYTLSTVGLPIYKPDELKMSFCIGASSSSLSCFVETSEFSLTSASAVESTNRLTIVGDLDELNGAAWAAFDSGRVHVKVSTPIHPGGELKVVNVTVPNDCFRRRVNHQEDMLVAEERQDVQKPVRSECDFEGTVQKEGDIFHSLHRNCTLCSCQRGSVKCERVLCPVLSCSVSLVQSDGDCCPTCPTEKAANGKRCYWVGDRKWHDAGASWHPYIAPFGFSKCALCTCQANGEVTCTKTTCPTLSCPRQLWYRENALDCCAKCRNPDQTPGTNYQRSSTPSTAVLDDESKYGRCYFNNRWYDEDVVFSPKISHVTTLKCIHCICRKSRVNCRRPMCSELDCDDPVRKNGCCPKCSGGIKTSGVRA